MNGKRCSLTLFQVILAIKKPVCVSLNDLNVVVRFSRREAYKWRFSDYNVLCWGGLNGTERWHLNPEARTLIL
ncbi:MAG: hypothetical protein AAGA66_03405 [Bacteroidota bacterium]